MHKKFEINRTKIKDGCQSGREVVTHNSKSDLLVASLLSASGLKINVSLEKNIRVKYSVSRFLLLFLSRL